MSRSGYSEDCEYLDLYRHSVERAISGQRGQKFLRDFISALDALPSKRLIDGELECGGDVCSLGSVGKLRGIDMARLDVDDHDSISKTFGIARVMAAEIMFENDEGVAYFNRETPEQRWVRMRQWAASNLKDHLTD